ncbi:unnamed protein product [Parascedosporium putredinis]|uniref:Uncharacterized protein n=1 Tax=Parascedosporium putredinis TaxID=1442378 RepID=A0A9P1MB21_9PEZI|nr:unnamed protein product [Parascedosporium putredinis]CAI7998699.1 unnamed protein product [Parascedosporium putredinis]
MALFPGSALVTGAASGIGRQVAISFIQEGCSRIALLDRNAEGLEETSQLCKQIDPAAHVFKLEFDARNEKDIDLAISAAHHALGRIDYALDVADFDDVTTINYRGLWIAQRAEISHMLKQEPLATHDGRPGNRGAVVNIASNLGIVSRPETPAYNGSKAAVVSLTKTDAIDYSKHNIRVNCVCPGLVQTPMTKDLPPDDPAMFVAPMGRMAQPQEVADAVLFLCSSKATYIQGAALSVDGGYTIN